MATSPRLSVHYVVNKGRWPTAHAYKGVCHNTGNHEPQEFPTSSCSCVDIVLLLQQSACHASAIHVDVEESLEEESGVTKTGSGEAEDDNNVMSSGCHRVSKIVNFEAGHLLFIVNRVDLISRGLVTCVHFI